MLVKPYLKKNDITSIYIGYIRQTKIQMSFKFCEICSNMVSYRCNNANVLTEQCDKCNKEEVVVSTGKAILLSHKKFSNNDMLFKQIKNNPYHRYDNTLGRIRDPNISGTDDLLIPIKYDQKNMKYCMKNEKTGEVFTVSKE